MPIKNILKFKAAVRTKYGPPEVIEIKQLDFPTLKENEILIRVYFTTINRTDCGVLWGKPFIFRFFTGLLRPSFASTGTDFAGIIESVGSQVTSFKKNDHIFGFNDEGLGSHRQYLVISTDIPMARIPPDISFEQAAASIEGAHYAYNFISKVKLNKGDRVLLNGATGAIGSAALQILKRLKVDLVAVCATPHIDYVKSFGVEKIYDYTREDFTQDESSYDKYDFIFDAAGKNSFSRCKHLLKKNGVYISSELGDHSENLFWALVTPLLGRKKVIFPFPIKIQRSLDFVIKILESGEFKPLIDRTYSLEKIAEAYHYVASGQKIGNVLLDLRN